MPKRSSTPVYDLCYAQNKLFRSLNTKLQKFLKEYELTFNQLLVLGRVHTQKGVNSTEIAESLFMSKPQLSPITSDLEMKRLIKSRETAEDLRLKTYSITIKGKRLIAKVESEAKPLISDWLVNQNN